MSPAEITNAIGTNIEEDKSKPNTPPPVEEEAKTLPPISLNLANRKRRPTLKVDVSTSKNLLDIPGKNSVSGSIGATSVGAVQVAPT